VSDEGTTSPFQVLKLLYTELSSREISQELLASINTMRSHTKNIYGKLEVNNRPTAAQKAEKLNLF